MADDRKKIMARIREALKTPAPAHGGHGDAPAPAVSPSDTEVFTNQLPIIGNSGGFRPWLPPVGDDWEARAALFAENAAMLKAEFHLCDDEADLKVRLAELAREAEWTGIATHHGELTDGLLASLGLPLLHTDGGYAVGELEACSVGITQCEALVAQTGSVLITNRATGGRALSVLPPHHVVLARREQLLPDLTAAFALLHEKYEGNYPSMMSFITGPSRTGDIERILVLGAHGPKRLTIYCV